ncbi:hypothetical protein CB1_000185005 [Camelus ferus]|nr:hypothetical protein CB1_000185005 [Camelus ferus]
MLHIRRNIPVGERRKALDDTDSSPEPLLLRHPAVHSFDFPGSVSLGTLLVPRSGRNNDHVQGCHPFKHDIFHLEKADGLWWVKTAAQRERKSEGKIPSEMEAVPEAGPHGERPCWQTWHQIASDLSRTSTLQTRYIAYRKRREALDDEYSIPDGEKFWKHRAPRQCLEMFAEVYLGDRYSRAVPPHPSRSTPEFGEGKKEGILGFSQPSLSYAFSGLCPSAEGAGGSDRVSGHLPFKPNMVSQLEAEEELWMTERETQRNGCSGENRAAVLSGNRNQNEMENPRKAALKYISWEEPSCWQIWKQVSENGNHVMNRKGNNSICLENQEFLVLRTQDSRVNTYLSESQNQSRAEHINRKNDLRVCEGFMRKPPLSEPAETDTDQKPSKLLSSRDSALPQKKEERTTEFQVDPSESSLVWHLENWDIQNS